MKIGLFSVVLNDRPLEEVADYAAGLGYEMFELAAWRGSNHFDTDRAVEDPAYAKGIKKMLESKGIEISALSNHLSSTMVLPVGDSSLDEWAGTSDKDEMMALAGSLACETCTGSPLRRQPPPFHATKRWSRPGTSISPSTGSPSSSKAIKVV